MIMETGCKVLKNGWRTIVSATLFLQERQMLLQYQTALHKTILTPSTTCQERVKNLSMETLSESSSLVKFSESLKYLGSIVINCNVKFGYNGSTTFEYAR